jgi:hydrogenase/urease accessory protein HupE
VMWRWLLLLFVFVAAPLYADELRPGYMEFSQKTASQWKLVWKAPFKTGLTPATQPVLPKGCAVQGDWARELLGNSVMSTAPVFCTRDVAGQWIGLSGFGSSQTDVLLRVAPLGRPVQAMRLTAAEPLVQITAKSGRWQVAGTYFVTGIEHILFGYDHLLFVISLILLLNGAWTVAKAVTAFTVAHSITLIGTTLGIFGLPQAPVESVIALSIIFLAVEVTKKEPGQVRLSQRIPWVIAFLFGLLHGFGFAGALKEIGLPESDVPVALLTFNLGVEAGQLVIVFTSLILLALLRRYAQPVRKPALRAITYAIGITASYWFIDRLFA